MISWLLYARTSPISYPSLIFKDKQDRYADFFTDNAFFRKPPDQSW